MGGGLVAHRERDRDRVGAESDMVHGQVGTHDGISNEGEMKSDLELKEMKNGKGREGKICTYLQKSPKPSLTRADGELIEAQNGSLFEDNRGFLEESIYL